MAATVTANAQTVVHQKSGGVVVTIDVCKTPIGPSMVPVPYVNVARSADTSKGSRTVRMDGCPVMLRGSVFSKSTGDAPGSGGGVKSGTTRSTAKFISHSGNVTVEGKNICRRLDTMISNNGNTSSAKLNQANTAAAEATGESVISFAFVFEHPDVVTGRVTQPLMESPWSIEGPEKASCDEPGQYVAIVANAVPGDYTIKLANPDIKERPLGRRIK